MTILFTAAKLGSFFVPCLRPRLNRQHVLLMKRIYENRLLFDEAVKLGGNDCVLDAGAGTCTSRSILSSSFFGLTPIDGRRLGTGIVEGGPQECTDLCNRYISREFPAFCNDTFERPPEYRQQYVLSARMVQQIQLRSPASSVWRFASK